VLLDWIRPFAQGRFQGVGPEAMAGAVQCEGGASNQIGSAISTARGQTVLKAQLNAKGNAGN